MKTTTRKLVGYLYPKIIWNSSGSDAMDKLALGIDGEITELLKQGTKFKLTLSDGRTLKINVKEV